jgi:hypothetical protein
MWRLCTKLLHVWLHKNTQGFPAQGKRNTTNASTNSKPPTTSSGVSPTSHKSGLSRGDKATIKVRVTIGVLVLIALAVGFILLYTRKEMPKLN